MEDGARCSRLCIGNLAHPLFFFVFCIRVFAWSDQRHDANESCCLLKPAAPLRSRVQCVLCGAGFFNCEKCDDWGRATSLLWEGPRGDS